jgi:glycine cleavage system transcriptional repressor
MRRLIVCGWHPTFQRAWALAPPGPLMHRHEAGMLKAMSHYLLAIQGHNRTGIVAQVTGLLYRYGVNITDSSMTTLRSEFTMMMVTEVPATVDLSQFEQDLNTLNSTSLSVFFRPLAHAEAEHGDDASTPNHSLSVLGRDQTGMIFRFSEALAQQGVNITDVHTRLLDGKAPALYAMILELYVPESTSVTTIGTAVREVAQSLGVDANFHPLAQIPL